MKHSINSQELTTAQKAAINNKELAEVEPATAESDNSKLITVNLRTFLSTGDCVLFSFAWDRQDFFDADWEEKAPISQPWYTYKDTFVTVELDGNEDEDTYMDKLAIAYYKTVIGKAVAYWVKELNDFQPYGTRIEDDDKKRFIDVTERLRRDCINFGLTSEAKKLEAALQKAITRKGMGLKRCINGYCY